MPRECLQPKGPCDTRYVHGASCTWHAPIAEAAERKDSHQPCCPACGGDLRELSTEDDFHAATQQMGRSLPEYPLLMDWSRGRCFPDFNTLENAYRQAMEGESCFVPTHHEGETA